MGTATNSLKARCLAEGLGTYVLVFFGCGAVHTAVLTGAQAGIWQVAIVWGVAVTLAVYVVGGVSGAHINPAVTVALAAWGSFSRRDVVPYVLSQLAGAFLAAATLFLFFNHYLAKKETERLITRGEPGSEITAMCYGEFYPNPGNVAKDEKLKGKELQEALAKERELLSQPVAFLVEVLGTLLLALVIFAVTDERNSAASAARLAPVMIGLTVAIVISVIGPLTQSCLNPARDFGPRLFTFLAGWGTAALPGPNGAGFFTVFIVAPVVGAVAGGGLYRYGVQPFLPLAPNSDRN
jgi:glycerol uptake facilitator protein